MRLLKCATHVTKTTKSHHILQYRCRQFWKHTLQNTSKPCSSTQSECPSQIYLHSYKNHNSHCSQTQMKYCNGNSKALFTLTVHWQLHKTTKATQFPASIMILNVIGHETQSKQKHGSCRKLTRFSSQTQTAVLVTSLNQQC